MRRRQPVRTFDKFVLEEWAPLVTAPPPEWWLEDGHTHARWVRYKAHQLFVMARYEARKAERASAWN